MINRNYCITLKKKETRVMLLGDKQKLLNILIKSTVLFFSAIGRVYDRELRVSRNVFL